MSMQAVYFHDAPTLAGKPIDDAYAERNYHLCRTVNINGLGVQLDKMVEAGMPKDQADCFVIMAESLLALMRTENNRLRAQLHAKATGQ